MSSGPFVGFTVMAGGAYLVDCAVQDRAPIGTLKAIIQNPSDIRGALESQPPAYPSGGAVVPPGGTEPGSPGGGLGTDTISRVIAFWRAQIGKPYQWGATGPNSYDCSGLMYAGYRSVGISIPRTTYGMLASTRLQRIRTLSACEPGDIIFPYPGHCFGYIGGGQMIEAPHTGENIHQASVYKFWTARRVIASGGGGGGKK